MSFPEQENALEKIKKTQENISVFIGTLFTVTMCIYFFTYALLADRGLSAALWAMGISVIVMLLILAYLKRVSFFLTSLWLGHRSELRDAFAKLHAANSRKKAQ